MDKGVRRETESEGSPIAKFRFGRTEIGYKATMLGQQSFGFGEPHSQT